MSTQPHEIRPRLPAELAPFVDVMKADPAFIADRLRGLTPDRTVEVDRQKSRMAAELRDTKRLYKAALESLAEVEEQRDVLIAQVDASPTYRIRPPKDTKADHGAAILVLSDWHVEERVDSEVVDGLNEYNLDIAKARVTEMFGNALKRIGKHRRDLAIDTLVMAVIGDIITGYIHEELKEENPISPTEAVIFGGELLHAGIRLMLDEGEFKEIVIPCCRGNHGRTTVKRQIASDWKNSYEWLMYQTLRSRFEGEKRVRFVIPKSQTTYVDVFDKRIAFHHGDAFRSAGGIGGIAPPLLKWLHRVNEQMPRDMTFIGHWHQTLIPARDCCVNGSIIGLNAYAKEIGAKPEPPQQTLRILSRKRGFTTHEPIMCG